MPKLLADKVGSLTLTNPVILLVSHCSQLTPNMVYNGHAITDIVLFWGNFNGQGH